MDNKAIRTIVAFGIVGTLLLAVMMMFTLDQTVDRETPEIARELAREYVRALQETKDPPPVELHLERQGKGASSRRVYSLTIRPSDSVAAEPPSVARLMYRASETCAGAIGRTSSEVWIKCAAALPDGSRKEAVYLRDFDDTETGSILKERAEIPPLPGPVETAAR